MTGPVGEIVRRWVAAYTAGLPPEERAARRDEIDDDLWCQLQESIALGRSAGSLRAEILVRLVLGMPADLSWRLSQPTVQTGPSEGSAEMSIRMVGTLWVVAGATFVSAAVVVALLGPETSLGPLGVLVVAVGSIGALAFVGAVLGLVWQFRRRLGRLSALAAGVAALGMVFVVIDLPPTWVLLPLGSTILVWDLARIHAVPRILPIVFAGASILMLIPLATPALGINGPTGTPIQAALGLPYLLSWIALGLSLVRRAPAAPVPATGS